MNAVVTAALVSAGIGGLVALFGHLVARQANRRNADQEDKRITTEEFEKLLERQSHYIDTLEGKIKYQIDYIRQLEDQVDDGRVEIMALNSQKREWAAERIRLERELATVKSNHEDLLRKYRELVGTGEQDR